MKVLSFFSRLFLILAVFTVAAFAQTTTTFSNPNRIVINDASIANPYPSSITVSGLSGTIANTPGSVQVRLNGFSHTYPADVGIVLVGPTGAAFEIQSGSSEAPAVNLTYTISDTGATLLPGIPALVNGTTYRPASYYLDTVYPAPGPGTNYRIPAPAGAQSSQGVNSTFTSVFGGTAPNGVWSLYILDAESPDSGEIATGWTLSLTTVGGATPTPTPTPATPTPTPTPVTPTPTPTPVTPTPTPTPTPVTPTPTPTPVTPTPTPTPVTPTPTPTPVTPTPTPTPVTPTPTPTPVTPTPTPTPNPGTPTPTPSNAASFVGVNTANQLVGFNFPNTNFGTFPSNITGLQTGENILGIDFRPATGQLYALGSSSRLYTINLSTGAATQVGTAGAFTLSGTNFGFDFNPSVDRIRVISDTGQNLRLNPNDGTLAGTDTVLTPTTTGATAAAYTNNFAGTATTTLYVIDTNTDTLYLQGGLNGTPSPNAGALTAVGALGVDASAINGFDIGSNGVAYAALTVGGATNIYTINLQTGAATLFLATGSTTSLRGFAVAPGSAASGAGRGTLLDFDGDRRADYVVFRPSIGTWFVRRSSNNSFFGVQFGLATDVPVPGDYDGDGRADIAVFRPGTDTSNNSVFYVLRSSDNAFQAVQFGLSGDEPVARDYNGDGRTDFAVVRRTGATGGANGQLTWFILTSNNFTFTATQFGFATDVVAPGDYDGDGRFDMAVYRGSGTGGDRTGPATFFVQRTTAGFQSVQFGLGSDSVVPGDYDGDGRTDFAVVRFGSPYTWYILTSSTFSFRAVEFGTKPFLTTQADYDGDGRTDISVWNPANGVFSTLQSTTNTITQVQFGQNGDYPVANFDTH